MKTLVFAMLFCSSAFGQTDLWKQLDQKFTKPTLCHAIVNNESYTVRRKTCSKFGCDEWDYKTVTACGPNAQGSLEARVDLVKMDGKTFSSQKLSEATWAQVNGNFMRILAKNFESYGVKLELLGLVQEKGLLKASYQVVKPDTKNIVETGYWLIGEGPFIGQVIEKQKVVNGLIQETATDRLLE